jgi:hypothetical protein
VKKVGEYLVEALEITRARYGPDHPLTFAGTNAVIQLYLAIGDFARAETFVRNHLAYCLRHNPEGAERYLVEGELGVCLLGQKDLPRAEAALNLAYRWMTYPGQQVPETVREAFKTCASRVVQLCEAMGEKARATTWRMRRADLDFPADPFARP